LRHVGPAAGTVAAAWYQVDEADLVDFAQVRTLDNVAGRDDALDIELEPVDVGDVEFSCQPVSGGAVGSITNQPGAVRQLDDRANLVEAGGLGVPADARETGEVGIVRLVLEGNGSRRRAHAGPDVNRVVLVACGTGELNLLRGRAVEFQLERRVGDRLLRYRMFIVGRRLFPLLAEEERRPCDSRSGGASTRRRPGCRGLLGA